MELLQKAKFTELFEQDAWRLNPGDCRFVKRDGALIAFRVGQGPAYEGGFRMIGAHTDSPNLRIKPLADVSKEGYAQLGVEVYGNPLLYTWFDRDLGLAGRIWIKSPDDRLQEQLLNIDESILRIPSLAIHLNRDILQEGLKLNAQAHLIPVLGLGDAYSLRQLLAERTDVEASQILSWDLSLHDISKPTLGGCQDEFVFASRLDNQAMCHAAITSLVQADKALSKASQMICLYNHEEVGSASYSGAEGSFADDILKRICESEGPDAKAGTLPRACALSLHISADMAHAIHPNYSERHEPQHLPRLNQGPVIKSNASQRYATSGESGALFELICQDVGIPYQKFVNRNDLACGSTIGPIAATRLGIKTVDVGNPMLSMHSIREQAGAYDHEPMVKVMTRFLGG